MAKWAKSSRYAVFRQAVGLAAERAASPGEAIMYGVFGAPMRYGGFACHRLSAKGMELNKRIDFDVNSMHMAGGMTHCICDAYIEAASTDMEYNGLGHEETKAKIHDDNRNNGLDGMDINLVVVQREHMRDIVALEAIAKKMYERAGVRFRYRVDGYRVLQQNWLNGLRRGVGLPPV